MLSLFSYLFVFLCTSFGFSFAFGHYTFVLVFSLVLDMMRVLCVTSMCLSKELFAHGRMSKHPQTTLSLCLVLSLVYCFPFIVADLRCDILAFSYASMSKLKMYNQALLYSLQSKLSL